MATEKIAKKETVVRVDLPRWDEEFCGMRWQDMSQEAEGEVAQKLNFALFRWGLLTEEEASFKSKGEAAKYYHKITCRMKTLRAKAWRYQAAADAAELARPFGRSTVRLINQNKKNMGTKKTKKEGA